MFLFFFVLALIIYYPIASYMLIDDGISGLWEVKNMNWGDILRSDHFKSLYQIHYAFLYLYLHIFGTNSLHYFVWFVLLFSANITMFYRVMPSLFALFEQPLSRFFFLLVCLLLLIAPNNFENISWAATSHYNIGMLLYLFMLSAFIGYVNGKHLLLYVFYILFFLSLFVIEMSLMFPFGILLIIILYAAQLNDKKIFKRLLLKFFAPMLLMVLGSFVLLKVLNNQFLPHGGSLESILPSVDLMVTNFWLFCMQGVAYTKFISPTTRDAYYAFVHQNMFWPLVLLTIAVIVYCVRAKKFLFLLLFLSIAIFISPNLFRFGFSSSSYENVRFIFFALPFILTAWFYLVRKNVWILTSFFLVFAVLNITFLNQSKQDKIIAGKLHEAYLKGVVEYSSPNTYLLNIPSFCKQFFVFRSILRVGIDANMKDATLNANDYTEVMWYYAQDMTDSFSVEKLDDGKLFVQNNTNGVWLMREHFGATSYENDNVIVEILEWGGYTIEFKNELHADAKLLLYSNKSVRNVRHLLD